METADLNLNIVDSYFGFLKNLSPTNKRELISKLTTSLEDNSKADRTTLESVFGTFETDKTVDEMIIEIKEARRFN